MPSKIMKDDMHQTSADWTKMSYVIRDSTTETMHNIQYDNLYDVDIL